LAQAEGDYPILKLNAASWAVMGGKREVRLIQLVRGQKRGAGSPSAAGASPGLPAGADADLFEVLRQLRRQEAARANVQPYQVFPDTVLAEMARGRPTTEDALRRVSGVGDFRLQSYGRLFLDAIIAHCRETGLATDVPAPRTATPPAARPAASSPSPRKVEAFRLFRSGMSVADAAAQLGLTPSTVNEYLADFVRTEKPASIFGWVPEDVCERVAAAAEIHGTARLKPVFLELNGEVPYDAIRIVFAFLESRG
jgi:ATP-dependent DNA helicase RecQ